MNKQNLVIATIAGLACTTNAFAAELDTLMTAEQAAAGLEMGTSLMIVGGFFVVSVILTVFGLIVNGFAMGRRVKSWNTLVPHLTAIRFGTATGYYDSPVTEIGHFAVWCRTENGVIDRVPHSVLVKQRLTVVAVEPKS